MTIGLIDDDSIAVSKQMIPISILDSALLVAKIKGFENLDQYIISLIKEDLESIKDTAQTLNENIVKFLEKNIIDKSSKDSTTNMEDLK